MPPIAMKPEGVSVTASMSVAGRRSWGKIPRAQLGSTQRVHSATVWTPQDKGVRRRCIGIGQHARASPSRSRLITGSLLRPRLLELPLFFERKDHRV